MVFTVGMNVVPMLHGPEDACGHPVCEGVWPLQRHDLDCQSLSQAEVNRRPGHGLASLDEARGSPRHRPLPCARGRLDMGVDAARQVEHALDRCMDAGLQDDSDHEHA